MTKAKRTVKTTQVSKAVKPSFNTSEFNAWFEDFKEELRAKGMRNGDINTIDPETKVSAFKSGMSPKDAAE